MARATRAGTTGVWLVCLLLPLLLIGSCGPGRNEFAPACPVPDIPKQIGELTRYRGGSQDPRDIVVRARIFDIPGKCQPGDKGKVLATASVAIEVTRGPAMEGRSYTLPVFIAITDATTIYDEIEVPLIVEFPGGLDAIRVQSPEKEIELPVTVARSAASYGIVAGFRLTAEELAANRRGVRR